ncbi:class I SAM-dependent methyltransferase [archaeon]|nr:class I SAM-dependent methyltransferase [archaeon]
MILNKKGDAKGVSNLEEGSARCFEIEDQSFWFTHRKKCILTAVNSYPPKGTIYDIGGGNGHMTKAFQDEKYQVVLVEPNKTSIENARKRGVLNYIPSTFQKARLPKNRVPAIGLFDVLEHMPNDIKVLEYLNSRLSSSGKLYFTVPAHKWLWTNIDDLSGHYIRYNLSQLNQKLESAGFHTSYITYLFSFLPPFILLGRKLPELLGRPVKLEETNKDHHSSNFVLDALTSWELQQVKSDKTIPFGATILGVAHKTSSENGEPESLKGLLSEEEIK